MSDFVPGVDIDTKRRVVITREELRDRHSLATGMTRSGKTSLFVAPQIRSVMTPDRFGRLDDVVVVDGGGDNALFWGTVAEGDNLGRKVLPVFSHPDLDGYNFDPFQTFSTTIGGILQHAGTLMEAAAIAKARAYGEQWFWLNNMVRAIEAVKGAQRAGSPLTLKSISEYMEKNGSEFRDAQQIQYAIELLMQYPVISDVDTGTGKFIRWRDMERDNSIPYFYVPSLNEPTSPYLASLAVQSLTAFKMEQTLLGTNLRHVHVFWDEFQAAASAQFGELLSLSAKHNISFHLACQNLAQLRAAEPTLVDIVQINTGNQVFFSPHLEEEEKYVQQHSEIVPSTLKTRTMNAGGTSIGEREVPEHKLSHNQILRLSATRGCSVLVRRNQSQFAEPTKLYTEHVVDRDVYLLLKNRPLPLRPAPAEPQPAAAPTGWRRAPKDQAYRDRETAMEALRDQVEAWLSGIG